MAHPLCDLMNAVEKRKPHPCDNTCEYFRFPHLRRACVLSEVFSVLQGDMCFEYKEVNGARNIKEAR